jgi:hypothetical protein
MSSSTGMGVTGRPSNSVVSAITVFVGGGPGGAPTGGVRLRGS